MDYDNTRFSTRETDIVGLHIVTLKSVADARGVIRELFRESDFSPVGLPHDGWKQVNMTETRHGAVRGLHGEEMTKLVAVAEGSVFGAYVDLRPDSPSRGAVVTVELEKGMQVLVPKGVCNGFQSTSETPSQYIYCFDEEWVPGMKGYSVTPLDPELNIEWPIPISPDDRKQISQKDVDAPSLAEAMSSSSSVSTSS